MQLEGIHHITAITGDAPANVEFYVGVLGLRMVKKTVNQDDPTVYHLFYADDAGSPGADLTFFEYPGARPGRAGAGMVHRIVWRVARRRRSTSGSGGSPTRGIDSGRTEDGALRFADPEGLEHELVVSDVARRAADRRRARTSRASTRCRASTACAPTRSTPARSESLLRDTLGFSGGEDGRWEVRGEQRGGIYAYDPAPAERPIPGAGTVHHVAFATTLEEHDAWQQRVRARAHGRRP